MFDFLDTVPVEQGSYFRISLRKQMLIVDEVVTQDGCEMFCPTGNCQSQLGAHLLLCCQTFPDQSGNVIHLDALSLQVVVIVAVQLAMVSLLTDEIADLLLQFRILDQMPVGPYGFNKEALAIRE